MPTPIMGSGAWQGETRSSVLGCWDGGEAREFHSEEHESHTHHGQTCEFDNHVTHAREARTRVADAHGSQNRDSQSHWTDYEHLSQCDVMCLILMSSARHQWARIEVILHPSVPILPLFFRHDKCGCEHGLHRTIKINMSYKLKITLNNN